MPTTVSHVLFDFDGTLVDTIEPMIEVAAEMMLEAGGPSEPLSEPARARMANVASFRELFLIVTELLGGRQPCPWAEFRERFQPRWLAKQFRLMPGVEPVVRHLHRCRIPMAIATGNSQFFYRGIMAKFGSFFADHFQHCVSAADDPEVAGHEKPDPLVYRVAAARFRPPPDCFQHVLIFEDSPVGIRGALASGAQTVWVNGNHQQPELASKVTACLTSLENFDPTAFGLPSFPPVN